MTTTNWHLDGDTIESYRANALSAAMAASLEAHVVACAACRALVSERVDTTRVAGNWSAIADRIDEPRRTLAERALIRLGVRDHIARLIVLTPAFRLAWFAAVAVVSAMAIAASSDQTLLRGDRGSFSFLVLAPLLPVAGTAAAFVRTTDPAYEITVAAPFPAFELLLVRAAAVLVSSTVVSAVASLALPGSPWHATVWLLPALGLTTATLALARWVPLAGGAAALSALWLTGAAFTARTHSATDLVANYPAFEPVGQLAFLALALVSAVALSASRRSFDLRSTS